MRAPHIRQAREAARILIRYANGGEPPGRAYDRLFEQGNGAKVAAHLASLATEPEGKGGMPGLANALRGSLAARYVSPELVAAVSGTQPLFPEANP